MSVPRLVNLSVYGRLHLGSEPYSLYYNETIRSTSARRRARCDVISYNRARDSREISYTRILRSYILGKVSMHGAASMSCVS